MAIAIGCGPLIRWATAPTANSTTATRHAVRLRLASWSASRISTNPTTTETTWLATGTHSGPNRASRPPSRVCTNGIIVSSCSTPPSAVSAATARTAPRCGSCAGGATGMGCADGAIDGSATTEPPPAAPAAVDPSELEAPVPATLPATLPAGIGVGAVSGRGAPPGPPPGGGANSGRSVGNSRTSRMESTLASSMTSRSMPMPNPPVHGMPCSQGPDVVVVDVAGFGVAARLGPRLRLESLELLDRVVLLAVGVAELEAGDDQLEALDVRRVVAVHPGQRRDLAGVVDAEDRADDVVLHLLVVDLLHEPPGAPAALVGDPQPVQHRAGLVDRHRRVHRRRRSSPRSCRRSACAAMGW